jgi:TolB-like protein
MSAGFAGFSGDMKNVMESNHVTYAFSGVLRNAISRSAY